jgi:acylphosphatase
VTGEATPAGGSGTGQAAAARFLVSGRVQGVGFRWFVARRASELGLVGWATNLPGGQVEVVAEGPPAGLRLLEDSLRAGPRMARVESVEKSDIPHHMIAAKSFEIR